MSSENPYQSATEANEDAEEYSAYRPLPRSAYFSAGCSGVLVCLGTMFVGGMLIFMYVPLLARFLLFALLGLLCIGFCLGWISAWETLRLARKRKI